jgi:biopolymer transport protein ExbD
VSVKIRKSAALASLSITPLIDVVFLLLIFFLVTSKFAEKDKEMDLPLASASTAQPMNAATAKYINIDQQGAFFVDGQRMDPAEVEVMLRRLARDNPVSQKVIVNAHQSSPVKSTIRAIDLCRKAGIADPVFSTEGE